MKYALLVGAMGLASTTGYAQKPVEGIYLCTVAEKAGIRSLHFERAGPPFTFVDDDLPTRFEMQITPNGDAQQYRLIEIGYEGSDRDQRQWEDENSVLHSTYLGDVRVFEAVDAPAFLTLGHTRFPNSDGDLEFYHAGFEFAGGEDTFLSVRWGRCRKVD